MEKSTATSNNHSEQTHPASQNDIEQQNETEQQQPPQYENRDYSSSSNDRPTTPAPAYQGPQDKYAVPQGQSHQSFNSLPIQNLQSQKSGGMMHSIAALACFTSCLGCIPYLIGSLKDVHHQCGNCNMPLADYHRSGHTEVRCFQK
ncbi:Ff.00g067550.m01.CDS01 [Fusarium sp. VM40]|nr:Ff.00g067550.m01.CDS01 [Fusarium sp. VM40]